MTRRFDHIIWDWNGTLLDDLALSLEIINGILARRGRPTIDRARYHAIFGFPVRNYYAQLGLDTSDAAFRELSVEFISEYDRRRFETQLHPHARPLLQAIDASGMTQSIVSAYRHKTLCEIVAHFGLASHFVALAGLDNIFAHSKAELGRASLKRLGVPPERVLLIGDTLHDVEVASEMNVACWLVAHGHHPLDRLAAACDDVFSDLRALGAALELPV